jgi:hypothetical protein
MIKKVIGLIKKAIAWGKSVASESDGTGSASRVVKLLLASTCSAALLLYVFFKHDLPSADQLSALAKIIGAGSLGYVANMIKNGLKKDDPPPEDPEEAK